MRRAFSLMAVLLLSGCGIAMQEVSDQERQQINSAVAPSSQAAAEKAVVAYFTDRLIDPDSAHYKFMHYTRGGYITGTFYDQVRLFGVFMCGTINSRNRMGGYAGQNVFMAFFDPDRPDVVTAGSLDDGTPSGYRSASLPCSKVYGS